MVNLLSHGDLISKTLEPSLLKPTKESELDEQSRNVNIS